LQGSLSIERICQLASVSRNSFYRSLKERQPAEEEMEARSAIRVVRNQLWAVDITYIRLRSGVCVVLDAFSRKAVGWELDKTLAVRLPLAALLRALAENDSEHESASQPV